MAFLVPASTSSSSKKGLPKAQAQAQSRLLLPLLLLVVVAAGSVSLISLPHSSLLSNTPHLLHASIPIPTISTSISTSNAAAAASSHSNPTLLLEPSSPPPSPLLPHYNSTTSQQQQKEPYHDWNLFSKDFAQMLRDLKIFVYPDVSNHSAPFSKIFLPHPSPFHPKLGNYFSEHMFKINLLHSPFLASNPHPSPFLLPPLLHQCNAQ